jgi:hypothetical protein
MIHCQLLPKEKGWLLFKIVLFKMNQLQGVFLPNSVNFVWYENAPYAPFELQLSKHP